jgi:formiminotetrahydrofolate cyclodeaminase
VEEVKALKIDFLNASLAAIIVLLALIFFRLSEIFAKLTERQRLAEEKKRQSVEAYIKRSDRAREAWSKLSEDDRARFNDFHYEHAIGKISDQDYDTMKKELNEKTNGLCG